jgi:hypothetical protein
MRFFSNIAKPLRRWLRIHPPAELSPLSMEKARRSRRAHQEAWSETTFAASVPMIEGLSSSTAKRSRLPPRRASETFRFEVDGLHYHATISLFAEGERVAEVFLSNHRSGSQADAIARDAGVAASLAFQYGCPLDVLRNALLRDTRGRAATPLGAALDLVAEREGSQANAETAL